MSYFTDPKLFEDKESEISKIYEKLTQIAEEGHTSVDSLKTYQILVFNMALYGQGNQRLWEALIKLYVNTILQENKYNGGSYHIFSLIGFIIRQKYRGALETEEFEG